MYSLFGWGAVSDREPELEIIHRPARGRWRAPWPLLFVHGAHAGAWCWEEHFLSWFAARGYDCHAVSLRGHGRSRGKRTLHLHSLSDYVRDLDRVVQEMPEAPVVIGHSMGGLVVQKYLEERALPAVVLMASVPPSGLAGAVFRLLATDPMLFSQISLVHGGVSRPEDLRRVSRAAFSEQLDAQLAERYGARMQGESQRALLDMLFLNLPLLHRVKRCPMLVMGAGDDALFGPDMVEATAEAYGAELVVVPGLAHAMMLEREWLRAAEPLHAWLRRLAADRR